MCTWLLHFVNQFCNFRFPTVEAVPFLGSTAIHSRDLSLHGLQKRWEILAKGSARLTIQQQKNTALTITKCAASFITKQKIVYGHDLFHFHSEGCGISISKYNYSVTFHLAH
jgi:hypothetical protein